MIKFAPIADTKMVHVIHWTLLLGQKAKYELKATTYFELNAVTC